VSHFLLFQQKKVTKEKPTPGYARKPDENQQFEAPGQLARRYRRRTQTLPAGRRTIKTSNY
jgi:hypothetical protein